MKWLYLICVVSLFGQLQSATVPKKDKSTAKPNISTKPSSPATTPKGVILPTTTPAYTIEPLKPSSKVSLGVAIIYDRNELICSGIHLKPWILLTVADCLFGRTPETLHAMVTVGANKTRYDVKARFYEIHPGYRYEGYMQHNFAVLVLNAEKSWDVAEFKVSFMTNDQKFILPSTYVDEWYPDTVGFKRYYFLIPDARKAVNMSACNAKDTLGFFCVKSSNNLGIYNKEHIGIPFYEWTEGGPKQLLGLSMGFNLGFKTDGHVFLDFAPDYGWVLQEIQNYPRPPTIH